MPHIPIWNAMAKMAVMRLRQNEIPFEDSYNLEAELRDGGTLGDTNSATRRLRKMSDRRPVSPIFALAASSEAMQIPEEEQQAVRDAGGDPLAVDGTGRARAEVVIPHAKLQMALRLCATIGSAEGLSEMLAPDGLTVFEVGQTDPVKLRNILEIAVLPTDVSVAREWPVRDAGGDLHVCVVLLREIKDPFARARMLEQLTLALEQPYPVVVLAASLADLPAHILRSLPPPRCLAPLSRDIMIAHLCASHSATGKLDAGLRERLPGDAELARLTWPALAVALRAPLAQEVANRLQDLTRVRTVGGPTLADIEGYGASEAAVRRMVDDLRGWSEGRIAWRDVQRSVLLHGAPGTGKSHLALAMANSAGVTLVRGSFAQWQSRGHLGDMLRAMRESFAEAAQQRPAILVIDEIDAVGDRSDTDRQGGRYQMQVINGFLEEMDRLKAMEGVLVVGTCNYPEKIDAAVLRPGRFDLKVEVPLPGPKALARMVRDGFPGSLSEADLVRLTRAAAGSSAADVDGALRQAGSAARAETRGVTVADVLRALDPDVEDENPDRDKRVALHECGHALVGAYLGVGQVKRLSYVGQGGRCWIRFATGQGTLQEWEDELAYLLAGRAAERLILGGVTSGAGGPAHSDLAKATTLAVRIDTHLGLGAEGLVWHDLSTSAYLGDPKNAARVRARLEAAEFRASQIIEVQRDVLMGMAADLTAHRMLEGPVLEGWLVKIEESSEVGSGLAMPMG